MYMSRFISIWILKYKKRHGFSFLLIGCRDSVQSGTIHSWKTGLWYINTCSLWKYLQPTVFLCCCYANDLYFLVLRGAKSSFFCVLFTDSVPVFSDCDDRKETSKRFVFVLETLLYLCPLLANICLNADAYPDPVLSLLRHYTWFTKWCNATPSVRMSRQQVFS